MRALHPSLPQGEVRGVAFAIRIPGWIVQMPLTRYGIREWGGAAVIAIILTIPIVWLLSSWWMYLALAIAWLAWLCIAAFFRDPIRHVPGHLDDDILVSPADGRISAIEHYESHEAVGGAPAVCIRIFLSVLNVHVNRAPCDATIVKSVHRPGKYFDARSEECARLNESNLVFMTRHWPNGIVEPFGVRQVSGKVARRIVDATKPGDEYQRGEHIGMIKFGSTTELILPRPDEVEVLVAVGQNVRAPRTPLARLHMPK